MAEGGRPIRTAEARVNADRPGLRPMLVVLCLATFLVTSTGVILAPFLLDMARELEADLAAVANLIALSSVTWGFASLAAGIVSDRVGRRPVLLAGLLVLGGALLGVASADAYPWLAGWQVVVGLGGGTFMGTVFATVSDHVPPERRGRALGWVITGQSLSFVLGVPLVTFIGSLAGWRGAIACQAVVTLLTMAAVWLAVPPAVARPSERAGSAGALKRVLSLQVLGLLGAGTMERLCFVVVAVYLPTYLQTVYGVSLQALAVVLVLVALGNLAGNFLGSQLTDRLRAPILFFAASSIAAGALALPLLLWAPGVGVTIGLGFVYFLANALGRPALIAGLSAVPSEVRGAVLGLNITAASVGWLGATALGGRLLIDFGFGSLGLLSAAAGLLGALLATLSWLAARRVATGALGGEPRPESTVPHTA